MKEKNYLVIMAGGIGSRFWPISTIDCPKQFIDILGNGRTLLQETVERFKDICPKENVWVVTSEKYATIVKEQLPQVPSTNILLEPCRRNTAPCIAYAAWRILKENRNANIIVTPSDHHINDGNEFRRVVSTALDFVADKDAILTIGIKPTHPDTGYGYIEAKEDTCSIDKYSIQEVESFKEKPDRETAEEYIAKENYFWNSGVFIWNVKTITDAIKRFEPKIAEIFEQMYPIFGTEKEQLEINESFPKCRNISIDYAVLERAENVYVISGDFGWSDLGTWNSLYDFLEHDKDGNALVGSNTTLSETNNCMIHTLQNKKVIFVGITNCIVAEHNGLLLICKKDKENIIKKLTDI